MANLLAPTSRVICSADLGRLQQCPAAGVYEWGGPKREASFPMWYGIFVHRFLQYAVERGRDAALKYVHSKNMKGVHKCCEGIDVEALPLGRCEVPLAHDVIDDYARDLTGTEGIRSLDVTREQYGRADLLGAHEGFVQVVDYKTGDIGEREPASEPQLLGLAASARQTEQDPWGLSGVSPGGVFVTLGGVMPTGEIRWARAFVTDEYLNIYVAQSRQIHLTVLENRDRAAAGIEPDFIKGPECAYCDLRQACPAWM